MTYSKMCSFSVSGEEILVSLLYYVFNNTDVFNPKILPSASVNVTSQ